MAPEAGSCSSTTGKGERTGTCPDRPRRLSVAGASGPRSPAARLVCETAVRDVGDVPAGTSERSGFPSTVLHYPSAYRRESGTVPSVATRGANGRTSLRTTMSEPATIALANSPVPEWAVRVGRPVEHALAPARSVPHRCRRGRRADTVGTTSRRFGPPTPGPPAVPDVPQCRPAARRIEITRL